MSKQTIYEGIGAIDALYRVSEKAKFLSSLIIDSAGHSRIEMDGLGFLLSDIAEETSIAKDVLEKVTIEREILPRQARLEAAG